MMSVKQRLKAGIGSSWSVGALAIALVLLPGCGRSRMSVAGAPELQIALSFESSASAGATGARAQRTAAVPNGLDSVDVLVSGLSDRGDVVPLARQALRLAPGQSSFLLQMRVPKANRYEVGVDAFGSRQRPARTRPTSYGLQYRGRAIVLGPNVSRTEVQVTMSDVVPRAIVRSRPVGQEGTEFVVFWPIVAGVDSFLVESTDVDYPLSEVVHGNFYVLPTSFGMPVAVSALLSLGRSSAQSEPIQLDDTPSLRTMFPSVLVASAGTAVLGLEGEFSAARVVMWSGEPIAVAPSGTGTLTVIVPERLTSVPGRVSVWVENGDGLASEPLAALIESEPSPPPTLVTMAPESLYASFSASSATLSGANFLDGAVVQFGAVRVQGTLLQDGRLVADIPFEVRGFSQTDSVWLVNPDNQRSQALSLSILPSPWRRIATRLVPRTRVAAVAARNQVFVAGGGPLSQPWGDIVESVNPSFGTGVLESALRNPKGAAAMCLVGDSLVLLGGLRDTLAGPNQDAVQLRAVVGAGLWSTGPFMITPRAYMGAGVLRGLIYSAGGELSTRRGTAGLSSVVEVYNPRVATWQTGVSMPFARSDGASAAIEGPSGNAASDRLYVFGGRERLAPAAATSRVEAYSPVGRSWSTLAPMPTPRQACAAGVLEGKVYVFGGMDAQPRDTVYSIVEAYDPATNTWASMEPMPAPLEAHVVVPYAGELYVLGGDDGAGRLNGTIYVYNPRLDVIGHGRSSPIPTVRAANRPGAWARRLFGGTR